MNESIDGLHEAPLLTPDAADETSANNPNNPNNPNSPGDPDNLNTDPHDVEESSDGDSESDERLAVALPHVALIGRAASGKTAIARALFGSDAEPTLVDIADRYQGGDAPLVLDDLPSWTHGNESSVDSLFSYLRTARDSGSPPDLIWYTLDASSARVTDFEIELLRRFANECPLAIVLTRCDLVAPDVLATMRSTLLAADIIGSHGVFNVAADPLPVLGVAPYGLGELIALTDAIIAPPADEPSATHASKITVTSPDAEETIPAPPPACAAPETSSGAPTGQTSPLSASPLTFNADTLDTGAPQPSPAPEVWRDAIQPPAPSEPPTANTLPSSSASLAPGRRGGGAGHMLVPVEEGPSTMSLIALAAVIALAIALLLLQLRRREEDD